MFSSAPSFPPASSFHIFPEPSAAALVTPSSASDDGPFAAELEAAAAALSAPLPLATTGTVGGGGGGFPGGAPFLFWQNADDTAAAAAAMGDYDGSRGGSPATDGEAGVVRVSPHPFAMRRRS